MLALAQFAAEGKLKSGRNAKLPRQSFLPQDLFAILPQDLLSSIIGLLDVKGLLSLQECDRRLQRLAGSEKLWRAVYVSRFGAPSNIQETAHKLAGSWQVLYKSKVVTEQAAGQWRKPCPYELQAALQTMIKGPARSPAASLDDADAGAGVDADADGDGVLRKNSPSSSTPPPPPAAASGGVDASGGNAAGSFRDGGSDSPARQLSHSSDNGGGDSSSLFSSGSIDSGLMNNSEGQQQQQEEGGAHTKLSVIFMLDSSGSVGDEDFTTMTDFLDTAAQAVADVKDCKVCVVQFSNDTRVEVPLGPLDKPAFDTAIRGMVRLNGGTNIAAAVAKAGSLLKAEEATNSRDMRRVLVLLTDGRIDGFQAREAASMVARLADEQCNVALWAFGVGRGVDSAELMRIIEGPGEACRGLGKEQYMDLCVRDDAPW